MNRILKRIKLLKKIESAIYSTCSELQKIICKTLYEENGRFFFKETNESLQKENYLLILKKRYNRYKFCFYKKW
jgi:hypothetical protein